MCRLSSAHVAGIVEALVSEGVVIVCTSNRAPWELSPAGVHEELFAHFVGVLQRACPPFELSSERDYRRVAAAAQLVRTAWWPEVGRGTGRPTFLFLWCCLRWRPSARGAAMVICVRQTRPTTTKLCLAWPAVQAMQQHLHWWHADLQAASSQARRACCTAIASSVQPFASI